MEIHRNKEEEQKNGRTQPQEFDIQQQLQAWQAQHSDSLNEILTYIENEIPREFVEEIEKAEQKLDEMLIFEKEILE